MMICGAIVIFWKGEIVQGGALIAGGMTAIKTMEVATLSQAFRSEPPKEVQNQDPLENLNTTVEDAPQPLDFPKVDAP